MYMQCGHSKKLNFTPLFLKEATESDQDLDLAQFRIRWAAVASNCNIWIWSPTASALKTYSDPKEEQDEDAVFPLKA